MSIIPLTRDLTNSIESKIDDIQKFFKNISGNFLALLVTVRPRQSPNFAYMLEPSRSPVSNLTLELNAMNLNIPPSG